MRQIEGGVGDRLPGAYDRELREAIEPAHLPSVEMLRRVEIGDLGRYLAREWRRVEPFDATNPGSGRSNAFQQPGRSVADRGDRADARDNNTMGHPDMPPLGER